MELIPDKNWFDMRIFVVYISDTLSIHPAIVAQYALLFIWLSLAQNVISHQIKSGE